jgi:hypothetical protein
MLRKNIVMASVGALLTKRGNGRVSMRSSLHWHLTPISPVSRVTGKLPWPIELYQALAENQFIHFFRLTYKSS